MRETAKAHKAKLTVLAVGGIAVFIGLLWWVGRAPPEEPTAPIISPEEGPKTETPAKTGDTRVETRTLNTGGATLVLPPPWTVSGAEGRIVPAGILMARSSPTS